MENFYVFLSPEWRKNVEKNQYRSHDAVFRRYFKRAGVSGGK